MNYYPGEGLGVCTAVIGNTVGQSYPAGTILALCKIWGILVDVTAQPVGEAGTTLSKGATGVQIVPTWKGVIVTASLLLAGTRVGKVVTIAKAEGTSNEDGYFELYVVKGLTVNVASPVFGKIITVDTTGLDSVDISTFF